MTLHGGNSSQVFAPRTRGFRVIRIKQSCSRLPNYFLLRGSFSAPCSLASSPPFLLFLEHARLFLGVGALAPAGPQSLRWCSCSNGSLSALLKRAASGPIPGTQLGGGVFRLDMMNLLSNSSLPKLMDSVLHLLSGHFWHQNP